MLLWEIPSEIYAYLYTYIHFIYVFYTYMYTNCFIICHPGGMGQDGSCSNGAANHAFLTTQVVCLQS